MKKKNKILPMLIIASLLAISILSVSTYGAEPPGRYTYVITGHILSVSGSGTTRTIGMDTNGNGQIDFTREFDITYTPQLDTPFLRVCLTVTITYRLQYSNGEFTRYITSITPIINPRAPSPPNDSN